MKFYFNLKLLVFFFLVFNSVFLYFYSKYYSSIFSISLVLFSLIFSKYKSSEIKIFIGLLSLLFLNIIFHNNYNFDFYFFSQINHYIQFIFYFLFFSNFFRNFNIEDLLLYFKKHIWIFFIFFSLMNFYNLYLYGNFFSEFNILSFFIIFSIFIFPHKKSFLPFIFIILFYLFFFSRLSNYLILLFFILCYFTSEINVIKFNKIIIILLPFFLFLLIVISSKLELLIYIRDHIDHNIFFRLEMLRQAISYFNSNFLNFIFGVGFGVPYRIDNNSLSQLHHFSDIYSINVIPNHNSIFDLFYRLGIFGLLPFLILQYKIYKINIISINSYILAVTNLFLIFEFLSNPWFEDQTQVVFSSLCFAIIFYTLSSCKYVNKS